MTRGGYDSIDPQEALRQAELGEAGLIRHRLFGVPGSAGEVVRLGLLFGLLAGVIGFGVLTGTALVRALPLAMVTAAICAVAAPFLVDWLMRPYRPGWLRGLLWGLCGAATFVLLLRISLALVLLAWLRLHGVDAEAAGIQSFHGAASFTLMLAMPAWIALAGWGLACRHAGRHLTALPAWRKILVPVFIVAVMIFMGAEGAYMDSLRR